MTHDLAALEQSLRREQAIYAYPETPWTRELQRDGRDVLDVVIIGGGQAGLTTATRLRMEGIRKVLVLDKAPEGHEGPWVTWARMETLRTAKYLHGTDAGFPSASFRSWYEAQHGEAGYQELGLIPRATWMQYLGWLRRVFDVHVLNDTTVTALRPEDGLWRVEASTPAGDGHHLARRVVVCTGWDGIGGPSIPPVVADLPREVWNHSSDLYDPADLAGKSVATLGAGASAFDNSAAALEAGAARVTHYVRRSSLPEVNTLRFLEARGIVSSYGAMDDALRLAFTRKTLSTPMPPPPHSVSRCTRHENFELRFSSSWESVRMVDGKIAIDTQHGTDVVDHLLLGTGFVVDLPKVDWLAPVRDDLVMWGDRAELGDSPVDLKIARHPYLSDTMHCFGKTPESDAMLRKLYMYNAAAYASVGDTCIGNNTMPYGSRMVAAGISRSLFLEDAHDFYEEYAAYQKPEHSLSALSAGSDARAELAADPV